MNTNISNLTTVTQYTPVQVDSNAIKTIINNGGDFQNNINGKNWNTIHTNAIKLANEVGLSYNGPRNGKYFFYALHQILH